MRHERDAERIAEALRHAQAVHRILDTVEHVERLGRMVQVETPYTTRPHLRRA